VGTHKAFQPGFRQLPGHTERKTRLPWGADFAAAAGLLYLGPYTEEVQKKEIMGKRMLWVRGGRKKDRGSLLEKGEEHQIGPRWDPYAGQVVAGKSAKEMFFRKNGKQK